MNNDALVAALGADAGYAIAGYRRHVCREAALRGLLIRPDLGSGSEPSGRRDPIDIEITLSPDPGADRCRVLRWNPERGWSLSSDGHIDYYAGRGATPLDLVPMAVDLIDWVLQEAIDPAHDGSSCPDGTELDDDPEAIKRLLGFVLGTSGQPLELQRNPPVEIGPVR